MVSPRPLLEISMVHLPFIAITILYKHRYSDYYYQCVMFDVHQCMEITKEM